MFNFLEFVNGNPTFKQFNVNELLFTAYNCPIEESPLDYWTQKNYFCYTIKGNLRWKTHNSEYYVSEGDALFLKKGAHRVYKILDDSEFCALLIFMPDEFIKSTLEAHTPKMHNGYNIVPTDGVIPLELNEVLSAYFFSVLNYFSQDTPPLKELLEIKFKELIMSILSGGKNSLLCHYFHEVCHDQKRSIKSIMEDNFAFNLKLAEYAKLCSRSLATFKRDFVKIYHTTPGRWLKVKRLEYAKFLLETTDMNINEITLESGFENTSHFVKSFKETYQYPPLHYKKLLEVN